MKGKSPKKAMKAAAKVKAAVPSAKKRKAAQDGARPELEDIMKLLPKDAQLDALGIRKSYTLTKEDCRSSISVILMKGTLYVKHIQTFGNPDVEMALEEEELTRNKFNCVEFGFKADPEKAWGIAKRLANWECGD